MYDTEVNKYRFCTRDNLLNCSQPHQHPSEGKETSVTMY